MTDVASGEHDRGQNDGDGDSDRLPGTLRGEQPSDIDFERIVNEQLL